MMNAYNGVFIFIFIYFRRVHQDWFLIQLHFIAYSRRKLPAVTELQLQYAIITTLSNVKIFTPNVITFFF